MFSVTSIYIISCLQLSTEPNLNLRLSLLQNVFTNLYKFFCTNISTIFRSSHRRCSIKKSYSEIFRDVHRKTRVIESLFYQAAGHQTCSLIKKRFQQIFPCEFREFITTLNLGTLVNGCIFEKCFVRAFFRSEHSKRNF